jgi:saccharopine dehydrogenase-like NADP-dependent oxidoreductase
MQTKQRAARRVVILGGAGAMGRITTRDFLRTARGRIEVVIGDRDPDAARDLGVEAVGVDVNDPDSLRRALDGAFAVIASLPYRFNLAAMQGALAAGAHYVDLGGLFHVTRRQFELAPDFESAGLMAILGMGSAPGILNVLAVHGAARLDRVRAIHCMVGAVDRTKYRNLPPLGFGYSPDTLLDEFLMDSAVFRAGKFRLVPALDAGEQVAERFPAPVGRVVLHSTLHSEVATLPLSFAKRGVREVTFRQAFEPETLAHLQFIVRMGFADTEPLLLGAGRGGARGVDAAGAPVSRRVIPRDVLNALLARFPAPEPIGKPNRYEILRTRVVGTQQGRKVSVVADCHAGPRAGWGIGPDIDTGAPPSIAVQLLASGEMPVRPGVWACEQVVPVAPFIRELERRGMQVRVRRERSGR